jgi:hypothetical protein
VLEEDRIFGSSGLNADWLRVAGIAICKIFFFFFREWDGDIFAETCQISLSSCHIFLAMPAPSGQSAKAVVMKPFFAVFTVLCNC